MHNSSRVDFSLNAEVLGSNEKLSEKRPATSRKAGEKPNFKMVGANKFSKAVGGAVRGHILIYDPPSLCEASAQIGTSSEADRDEETAPEALRMGMREVQGVGETADGSLEQAAKLTRKQARKSNYVDFDYKTYEEQSGSGAENFLKSSKSRGATLPDLMVNFANDRLQAILSDLFFLEPLRALKLDLEGEDDLQRTDLVNYDSAVECLTLFEGTMHML